MESIFTIAHRAGNSRALLNEALAASVDAVETDIRLDGRRLVSRHVRRFPLLPLFYDRWYAYWSREPQVSLDEILDQIKDRASLFVDIKSTSTKALAMLLATLRHRGVIAETRVSGTYWHLLRQLRIEEPELRVYYSIGDIDGLASFWQAQKDGEKAPGVSIHEALVDEESATRFRTSGVEIVAYHVDQLSRAQQLAGWGASGITSGDLGILRNLKEPGVSQDQPPV